MPLNRLKDKKLKEIFRYISDINQKAYMNIYLLSNPVLSKNPYTSNYINTYNNNYIVMPSFREVMMNLKGYYKNSFISFLEYVKRKIDWMKVRQRFQIKADTRELVIIDTFFLADRILKDGKFKELYFEGICKVLNKRNIVYAYLPVFINCASGIKLQDTLRLLVKDNIPVLTEYQLLSFSDLLRIIIFIILYPFYVLRLAYVEKEKSDISRVIKKELLNTIGHVTLHSFSRYLQGKRIASLPYNNIKLISWYENQVIDKNLYKGLRSDDSKVKIFGSQHFLWGDSIMYHQFDPSEIKHGIVPDKVLVNGNYYLFEDDRINIDIGPSFRNKKVFDYEINFNGRSDLLVALPYFQYEIINILNTIKNTVYKYGKIIIKFHPTTDIDCYRDHIPINTEISEDHIYDLFNRSKIILSIESGTLIEGIIAAIPAIVLYNPEKYSHNPLPSKGRSIVWDSANNGHDVERLIEKFNHKLDHEKDTLLKYAKIYKEMFFSEPTDEKIIDSFEL